MLDGKKIFVVMPAYNAARTLSQTFRELPHSIVDGVLLVDDHSSDSTVDVFANEMLAQVIYGQYPIGEISCPTKYFPEASSINFARSVKYGMGVLATSVKFRLQKMGLAKFRIFNPQGRKLFVDYYHEVTGSVPEQGHI